MSCPHCQDTGQIDHGAHVEPCGCQALDVRFLVRLGRGLGWRLEAKTPDWVAFRNDAGLPKDWTVRVVFKASNRGWLADAELLGPDAEHIALHARPFFLTDRLALESYLAQVKGTSTKDRIPKETA